VCRAVARVRAGIAAMPTGDAPGRQCVCLECARRRNLNLNRPEHRNRQEDPTPMAYVIAEPCIGTKDNSCVEVCPVDCIHPTPDEPDYDSVEMLYIDPEECIDCDACVEACPVDACFAEDQLPDEWQKYIQLNSDYYQKK
jgi:ferredoxin